MFQSHEIARAHAHTLSHRDSAAYLSIPITFDDFAHKSAHNTHMHTHTRLCAHCTRAKSCAHAQVKSTHVFRKRAEPITLA